VGGGLIKVLHLFFITPNAAIGAGFGILGLIFELIALVLIIKADKNNNKKL